MSKKDKAEDMQEPENESDAPKVGMLPPMVVLLFVAAGLTLNWIFPLHFGHLWGGIGLVLLGAACAIGFLGRSQLEKAGTNIAPNLPASVLVSDGVYQYTRNPMYLAFIVGFAGLSMLADAPLMLLLTAPLFFLFDRKTIPAEEEYLTDKFGAEYTDYQAQVKRWGVI